jgi:Methyltransferase domain
VTSCWSRARDLADLSNVQIRRARELVPSATFIWADATTVDFPTASFNAVLCPYVLIHLLLDEQPPLVARIATWLRSNGWFLPPPVTEPGPELPDNWLGYARLSVASPFRPEAVRGRWDNRDVIETQRGSEAGDGHLSRPVASRDRHV